MGRGSCQLGFSTALWSISVVKQYFFHSSQCHSLCRKGISVKFLNSVEYKEALFVGCKSLTLFIYLLCIVILEIVTNMTNCVENYSPTALKYKQSKNKLFLLMSYRAWGNIATHVQNEGGKIIIIKLQLELWMTTIPRGFFFKTLLCFHFLLSFFFVILFFCLVFKYRGWFNHLRFHLF